MQSVNLLRVVWLAFQVQVAELRWQSQEPQPLSNEGRLPLTVSLSSSPSIPMCAWPCSAVNSWLNRVQHCLLLYQSAKHSCSLHTGVSSLLAITAGLLTGWCVKLHMVMISLICWGCMSKPAEHKGVQGLRAGSCSAYACACICPCKHLQARPWACKGHIADKRGHTLGRSTML